MKITTVYYSSAFKKAALKYQAHKEVIKKRIQLFRENPFDPRLKTHQLTGKLAGYWAFSITYHIRI